MTHSPKTSLKKTNIPWIGEIPEDWEVKKLKYLATVNPGKSHPIDPNIDVVFLPMEKVESDWTIDQSIKKRTSEVSTGYTYFEKNDIIFAKITPCFENGKGALLSNLETAYGFGTTEFHILRTSKQETNNEFLKYIVQSDNFKKVGEAFMEGSAGQKRVTTEFLVNFQIPLPPSYIQTTIANFLDQKTTEIKKFIENKRKLIQLLKEQKQSIIHSAVTKGIDENAKMKDSEIPWIGEIPEDWEVKKLKYVAKLQSGESITSDSISPTGLFPVYGGNGLRGFTDRYTHDGSYSLIGRQGALCGNINYANGQFFASEHAVVVNILSTDELIWIGELLRTMNLNQYSQASAQPGLAVEKIANLYIPCPPGMTKARVVEYIKKESLQIDSAISKIEQEITLIEEYRTSLIYQAVTGKIQIP